MATYLVCNRCTTSVENNDWTWIDNFVQSPEEGEAYYNELTTNVEIMGNVTLTKCESTEGYFVCFVCSSDSLGANVYESE